MHTITIALDDDMVTWASAEAARRDVSLSMLIRNLLERECRHGRAYEAAMRAYLSGAPRPLRTAGDMYPKREEVYDRTVLR